MFVILSIDRPTLDYLNEYCSCIKIYYNINVIIVQLTYTTNYFDKVAKCVNVLVMKDVWQYTLVSITLIDIITSNMHYTAVRQCCVNFHCFAFCCGVITLLVRHKTETIKVN